MCVCERERECNMCVSIGTPDRQASVNYGGPNVGCSHYLGQTSGLFPLSLSLSLCVCVCARARPLIDLLHTIVRESFALPLHIIP